MQLPDGAQRRLPNVPEHQVIVTRPAQEAAQWVEQLRAASVNAVALPLIEISPITDPASTAALQAAWQNLQQYAACMFVSSNAVNYFFNPKEPADQQIRARAAIDLEASAPVDTLPTSLRFLAPGPGTAAALQSAGVSASQIDSPPPNAAQFDSAALWQVIGARDWRGTRVLVVRGNSTVSTGKAAAEASAVQPRDWLIEQWLAAGGQVDVLTVYERRAPFFTPAQLDLARTASADGSVWLFSSSEAVAHLRDVPALAGTDWSKATAIATHPRISDAARSAGFGTVLASRPALIEIVQALRSIESTAS
jgi:uroporphyrinogen-III synthase